MDENLDMITTVSEIDSQKKLLAKWLDFLYKVQIAGIVISLLAVVPVLSVLVGWLNRAVNVCVIIALLQLAPVNERYRKSAIFQIVALAGGLITLLMSNTILSLAVSITALIAAYQQYEAHSELTAQLDPGLSHKWHSLFYWEIAVGLLAGCVMVVGVVIGVLDGMELALIMGISLMVSALINLVLEVLYLVYMKKTMGYFQE